MLAITEFQLTQLRGAMWGRLRSALLQQIKRDFPAKVQGHPDEALEDYVLLMLQFGAKYRLERTPSLHRLVALQMQYNFKPDLDPSLRLALEQFALDESVRLDRFERALTGESGLKLIQLDSPMHAPEGWND